MRKLNNFNSVMAVIAGINSAAIHRMKFTREGIPRQSQEVITICYHLFINYLILTR